LGQLGINGLTVSEVRGYGRQKGHKEVYRGAEYEIDLTPKIKVELVVAAARAEEVIEAITAAARTGKLGDGKLFISDVSDAIRIRNGDRGEGVL
jgi:nitrogen regulatory protein P-II 1